MYQAEVLQKHPVIKHSYYGSVINLEKATDMKPEIETKMPPKTDIK